ncbi:hypothetical protein D3C75_787840 [compost metagenome]
MRRFAEPDTEALLKELFGDIADSIFHQRDGVMIHSRVMLAELDHQHRRLRLCIESNFVLR